MLCGLNGAADAAEAAQIAPLSGDVNKGCHAMNKMIRFMSDESGATAIEYGLIAALVGVAIITAVTTLGTKLSGTFSNVSAQL
jgi:pilus assembly protein Flp/PilA